MTHKVKPTVEKCELEEFLMMYHDAEGGLIVFEEDYKEFKSGLKNIIAHSVQEAKAEVLKEIENVASAGHVGEQTKLSFKWLILELESRWHKLSTLSTKEES